MDFALQQLIADTGDVRSAIRGHSLARDMFGNDASNNGYLAGNPSSGAPFTITNIQPVANSAGLYDFLTNIPIPAADPTFYGYNFTRWILRLSYTGSAIPRPVDQTFEILYDNSQTGDMTTAFTGSGFHVFRVTPVDATTALDNPTAAAQSGLAAWQNFLVQPQAGAAQFILDGRRLRAFNGPGMGAGAVYGNFRYNGGLLSGNATFTQPGDPDAVGMDEDYDACDLENWFLAIQSADGQVIIPSFHRPAASSGYDPQNGVNDWAAAPTRPRHWADSASRILRPVAADGHDPATFPDLVPDPATGKITFDVDNDADGVTDSVWLDLGYPARPDCERPALQAALRLPGHRPQRPNPAQHAPATWPPRAPPTPRTLATRSASSTRPMPCRTPTRAPRLTPIPSTSPASACPLTRATLRWTMRGSTSG